MPLPIGCQQQAIFSVQVFKSIKKELLNKVTEERYHPNQFYVEYLLETSSELILF